MTNSCRQAGRESFARCPTHGETLRKMLAAKVVSQNVTKSGRGSRQMREDADENPPALANDLTEWFERFPATGKAAP